MVIKQLFHDNQIIDGFKCFCRARDCETLTVNHKIMPLMTYNDVMMQEIYLILLLTLTHFVIKSDIWHTFSGAYMNC